MDFSNLEGFTWIDTIILVVYMVGVLLAGLYFSKKEMQGKEFFKGDGSVPWWVTCVSIFATLLSPISFLALAGNSYAGSWMLWFAQIGMIIAIPLTIKFFLPVYAKLGIDTAYHYLEIRYGSRGLRILGALMFVIFQLGRMSIVMYLPCLALAYLSGINVDILIIAMGAIAIVYSYTGGLKAVLWTDFIQGVILIGGITLTLIYIICSLNGGLSDITESLTTGGRFLADNEKWIDWSSLLSTSVILTLVGGGFTTFCSYVSSQDVVQRFTTTTDIKKLNKMTIGNGILSIFAASVFYLVGTALYLYYTQNPDMISSEIVNRRDLVFAYFMTYQVPVGITGILLAALYAASQSTLSTGINSVATSWVLDIQSQITPNMDNKRQTKIAQYVSLGIGIFAIVVAMWLARSDVKSAYELFNSFLGLALGALAGIFVMGAFTKKTSALGAFVGFIVSMLVVLYCKYEVPTINFWSYSMITIFTTTVVGIVVSLIQSKITGKEYVAPEGSTFMSATKD
jgi:SSS family solute:Na+ symporter